MNSEHRIKGFAPLFLSLTLGLVLLPAGAAAQQRGRGGATAPRAAKRQPDDKTTARRAQAIAVLSETANAARSFSDLLYRARIQLLAADALWPFDEARARQIFARAWEAATASDRAEQRVAEEEAGIFPNSEEVIETAARDEVLSRAAARDAKMAEGFLREMVAERERAKEAAKGNQADRRTPWREPSPLGARRLALAYELVEKREYQRAAAIVEPVLAEGASGDAVEFILRLRALMDGRSDPYGLYSRLLQRTAARSNMDANDLLLLSSYVVSPRLLMVVDEKGGLQYRPVAAALPLANQNPLEIQSSKYFYDLVVAYLLRPGPARGRATSPTQERVARFVVLGRLIPLFEQGGAEYAQYVPVMRSQLASLSSEMEAGRRDALSAQFELTSLTGKNARDPLAPQLEQLARAGDKYERDRISLGIARRAARERLWDRAGRAAYVIEDADLRRAALAFIVVSQIADISRAYKDDREDDFESVARFVRRADAPPFASAWGLAQAAVIAARKGSMEEINALLSEAQSYAERADRDSRQRVAAYAVITDAAARVSTARAWDFFSELVRAANSTPDYMGDETTLATSGNATANSELSEELSIASDSFRLDRVFATMARIDFDKTLGQAQALTGEIPRAYARIAAARAALGK
jgi:hypothetical protein